MPLPISAQVLQCLQQMIQARVQNMRSGWRTMFGVFSAASKVLTGMPVAIPVNGWHLCLSQKGLPILPSRL